MDEQAIRVVEAATDSLVKAITWDGEITLEYGRYATWLTAFCTAGLGLLVARSSEILANTAFGRWVVLVLGLSAALFVAGAVTGAILRRSLRSSYSLKRQQMTFLLTQKTYLLAANPGSVSLEHLPGQIWRREFLSAEQQEKFRALERRDEVELPEESRLIVLLELATALGFLLLLIGAFPGTW